MVCVCVSICILKSVFVNVCVRGDVCVGGGVMCECVFVWVSVPEQNVLQAELRANTKKHFCLVDNFKLGFDEDLRYNAIITNVTLSQCHQALPQCHQLNQWRSPLGGSF